MNRLATFFTEIFSFFAVLLGYNIEAPVVVTQGPVTIVASASSTLSRLETSESGNLETKNWKLFRARDVYHEPKETDLLYPFEVKIPDSWSLNNSQFGDFNPTNPFKENNFVQSYNFTNYSNEATCFSKNSSVNCEGINLNIYYSGRTLDRYTKKYYKFASSKVLTDGSLLLVQSRKAEIINSTTTNDIIVLKKGLYFYEFTLSSSDLIPIVKNMITTLVPVGKPNVGQSSVTYQMLDIEPSNLKTFNDAGYGFSVKYPSDWGEWGARGDNWYVGGHGDSVNIKVISAEKNYTLETFRTSSEFHNLDDHYQEFRLGGSTSGLNAVMYDIIVQRDLSRYNREILYGVQGLDGTFFIIEYKRNFETKEEAESGEMSDAKMFLDLMLFQ